MVGFSLKMLPKGRWGLSWRFFLGRLAGWAFPGGAWQRWLLRRMGVKIGKGVFIAPGVLLDPVNPAGIELQDGVFLGWGAQIWAHVINPRTDTLEPEYQVILGRVTIERGAFIGGFAFVTPIRERHVRIGARAVVGSHTFVDRSVEADTVVVGFPMRVVKKRGERGDRQL